MKSKIVIVGAVTLSVIISSFTFVPAKETSVASGKEIFVNNCARCHGTDGTKGRWGAKNLKESNLPDAAVLNIIANGKRIMPSWKLYLTKEEIQSVKEYVKTLRTK